MECFTFSQNLGVSTGSWETKVGLTDLKPVIDYLAQANPPVGYTWTNEEWDTLAIVKSALEPFRNMHLYLEAAEYVTIGFVSYC